MRKYKINSALIAKALCRKLLYFQDVLESRSNLTPAQRRHLIRIKTFNLKMGKNEKKIN